MKRTPPRWVRDLAPIPIGCNREIRLQVVEVNGNRRLTMATYARGEREWHRMPGCVEIPSGMIPELRNRLAAADGYDAWCEW